LDEWIEWITMKEHEWNSFTQRKDDHGKDDERKNERNSVKEKRERVCYRCGRKGHIIAWCPEGSFRDGYYGKNAQTQGNETTSDVTSGETRKGPADTAAENEQGPAGAQTANPRGLAILPARTRRKRRAGSSLSGGKKDRNGTHESKQPHGHCKY